MHWFAWLLVAVIGVETIIGIWTIGQPREPRDAKSMAFGAVINGLFIAGIARFWGCGQ